MVSIITPTYNRAHLLPRIINSVINQTFDDWELLVMDDGSSDNTEEIVAGFSESDSRIKFFSSENSGAADKRNKGVEKAKGSYIVFLDSDDEVKSNWLELLYEKIDTKVGVVCCGYSKYNEKGQLEKAALPQDLGAIFNHFEGNFLAGTLLIKKEIFLDVGGYDIFLSSGHHTDLMLRIVPFLVHNKMESRNVMKSLLIIHAHSGNKIRKNHRAVYEGTIKLLSKHKVLFQNNPEEHFNYISVAGYHAMKLGDVDNAKKHFWEAFNLRPFSFKAIGRLIISYLPSFKNLKN